MEIDEIIAVAKANAPAIVFVIGIAIVLFALARTIIARTTGSSRAFGSSSADEQRFRNVFGLMTDERREGLISYYMQKHKCGRREAMRIAVEDRASDETRWLRAIKTPPERGWGREEN